MDYESIGRSYVIPQYAENKEFLLAVDRKTKELVRKRFSMFSEYDWECNTIATCTLKSLISVLYLGVTGGVSDILGIVSEDDEHQPYIDFLGLLKIQPTMRRNEKAEKTGSINCKFIPGYRVNSIVEDDNLRGAEVEKQKVELYYLTENEKLDKAWESFDKLVRNELADKHGIILKYHYSTIGFTECFLECLYRELIMRLTMSGEIAQSALVNDYFEISAIAVTNADGSVGVKFTITPGKYSKLTIKSDATTEADEDDDEAPWKK